MPIEIRELVIRTTITSQQKSKSQSELDLEKLRREILSEISQQLRKKVGQQGER